MTNGAVTASAELIRQASGQEFWVGIAIGALLILLGLFLGFRSLQRARMMEDMPTSKLRSAAQGYVELEGWARMMPGEPIHAPLSGLPCTWYRYEVEHLETREDSEGRRSSEWHTIEKGVSDGIFFLEDGTGRCIVDPDGAEVTPSIRLCWRGDSPRPGFAPRESGWLSNMLSFGSYRYTEHRIQEQDHLFAVGQYAGLGDVAAASLADDIKDILAEWKSNKAALLRRFDLDRDGEISMQEWDAAREAAEQEALVRQANRPPPPELNVLGRPPYNKPFLLSTVPQHTLIARNRRYFAIATGLVLMLGGALGWVVTVRFG
jgi:hypothetical protein